MRGHFALLRRDDHSFFAQKRDGAPAIGTSECKRAFRFANVPFGNGGSRNASRAISLGKPPFVGFANEA
jgi:hypothetical protein